MARVLCGGSGHQGVGGGGATWGGQNAVREGRGAGDEFHAHATEGVLFHIQPTRGEEGGDRPPEVDGLGGMKAVAAVVGAYESAALGRAVTMDEMLSGTVDTYQREIDISLGLVD